MSITWQEGYLHQAMSDYHMYTQMNERNVPLCHRLHYLQMASEKLAKSFLCIGSEKPFKKTHYALVQFLNTSKRSPNIRRLLGYDRNPKAYSVYIDSLLSIAQRIEMLAPVGGNQERMNAEYPWEDDSGEVRIPSEYAFNELPRNDLVKIQSLLKALFRIAPEV